MHKKFLLLFMSAAFIWNCSQGQINMVLQVPPLGVMQKAQLWNMALVNNGNGVSVSVQLTLLNTTDNQPVMTAASRSVFVTKGTTVLTPKDVSPIQYDYLSPAFTDRDPNGFLPAGNYKACYSIMGVGHGQSILAEECIPIEVQPLSPPQLVTPADKDTIATAYPQFSWIPPAPLSIFSDLSYDLVLVEVLPGQAAHEAMQQNIPVYSIGRYQDVVHLYPASNHPLDTGRLYAWRILARNDGEFVDESEVWTFRLASSRLDTLKIPDDAFIPLRKNNELATGARSITNGILAIKFYSFARDHDTAVNFYNQEGRLIRSVTRRVKYGENYLVFQIDGVFEKKKIYRVEIADERSFKNSASFTIPEPLEAARPKVRH